MRLRHFTLIAIFVTGISPNLAAWPRTMQLLDPSTGWTGANGNLYWTTDAGHTWSKITPPIPINSDLKSVYFANPSEGWALTGERMARDVEHPQFQLAVTTNGGKDWTTTSISLPENVVQSTQPLGFSESGEIFFFDALHGWLNLVVNKSVAFPEGRLLSTSDGGKTWNWNPNNPYLVGGVTFRSLQDGWETSDDGQELYSTRNGGLSWQLIELKTPECPTTDDEPPLYSTPIFQGSGYVFETVIFPDINPKSQRACVALFESNDAGLNWRLIKLSKNLKVALDRGPNSFRVVDKTWIVPIDEPTREEGFVLTELNLGGSTPTTADARVLSYDIEFTSTLVGWVRGKGKLFATADGGQSWTLLTPAPPKPLPTRTRKAQGSPTP
jgi:photosystem II stability/assembly factor-like uncharacterized protein